MQLDAKQGCNTKFSLSKRENCGAGARVAVEREVLTMPVKERKLTAHDAELIRQLYESVPPGQKGHLGCRRLAGKFGVSRATIRKIVYYAMWTGHRVGGSRR